MACRRYAGWLILLSLLVACSSDGEEARGWSGGWRYPEYDRTYTHIVEYPLPEDVGIEAGASTRLSEQNADAPSVSDDAVLLVGEVIDRGIDIVLADRRRFYVYDLDLNLHSLVEPVADDLHPAFLSNHPDSDRDVLVYGTDSPADPRLVIYDGRGNLVSRHRYLTQDTISRRLVPFAEIDGSIFAASQEVWVDDPRGVVKFDLTDADSAPWLFSVPFEPIGGFVRETDSTLVVWCRPRATGGYGYLGRAPEYVGDADAATYLVRLSVDGSLRQWDRVYDDATALRGTGSIYPVPNSDSVVVVERFDGNNPYDESIHGPRVNIVRNAYANRAADNDRPGSLHVAASVEYEPGSEIDVRIIPGRRGASPSPRHERDFRIVVAHSDPDESELTLLDSSLEPIAAQTFAGEAVSLGAVTRPAGDERFGSFFALTGDSVVLFDGNLRERLSVQADSPRRMALVRADERRSGEADSEFGYLVVLGDVLSVFEIVADAR